MRVTPLSVTSPAGFHSLQGSHLSDEAPERAPLSGGAVNEALNEIATCPIKRAGRGGEPAAAAPRSLFAFSSTAFLQSTGIIY